MAIQHSLLLYCIFAALFCRGYQHLKVFTFSSKRLAPSSLRCDNTKSYSDLRFVDDISNSLELPEFVSFDNQNMELMEEIARRIRIYTSDFRRFKLLSTFLMEDDFDDDSNLEDNEMVTIEEDIENDYCEDELTTIGRVSKIWFNVHLMIAVTLGFRVDFQQRAFRWQPDLLPIGLENFLPREMIAAMHYNHSIPNFLRIMNQDPLQLTALLEATLPANPDSNDIIVDALMGIEYSQSMKKAILSRLNETNPNIIAPTKPPPPQTIEMNKSVVFDHPQISLELITSDSVEDDLLQEYMLRLAYRKRLIVQWLQSFSCLDSFMPDEPISATHMTNSVEVEDDDDGND